MPANYPTESSVPVFESSANSSTSTLLGAATFTGTSELNTQPDVMVSCYADVAGTLYFDFSINGTDWRTFPTSGFVVSAGIHEFHTAVKGPRYFRVRYVNGASAQSTFQLQTYYGTFRQPNAPLNQSIGADADALVVRPLDSGVDLALGRLGGVAEGALKGHNPAIVTTTDPEDVWTHGGVRTAPTSNFTPYLASSSASDTDVDVVVEYLDANGAEQTVTVNLNGQTSVSAGVTASETVKAYLGAASSNAAVGTVYCTNANNFTAGVPDNQNEVMWAFSAEDQETQLCAGRCPADRKMRIKWGNVLVARDNGSATAAVVKVQTRASGAAGWRTRISMEITSSNSFDRAITDLVLDAGEDIRVRVVTVSDNTTRVTASLLYDMITV